MILKRGIVLTERQKVLRLLCTVNGSISISEIEANDKIKIKTLTEMRKEELILMDDESVKITEKGIAENEETLDRGHELVS